MQIIPFNFTNLNYAPPSGLKVKRANDQCLILERNREGFREYFAVAKVKDDAKEQVEFTLFRFSERYGVVNFDFQSAQRLASGELQKCLALLGYKTGWKPRLTDLGEARII